MKVVIILLCLAAAANARPRLLRQQCAPTDPDCQQIEPKRQSGPPEDEEYEKFIDSLVDDILRNMGNGAGGLRDAPTTRELAEQLVKWVVGKAFDFIGFLRLRQKFGRKDSGVVLPCDLSDPNCPQTVPRRQSGPPEDEEYQKFIDSLVDDIMRNVGNGAGGLRDAPTTEELAEQLVKWVVGKAFEFIGLGKRRQTNGQYVPPQCNDLMDCPIISKRRQSGPPDEAAVNDFLNSIVDEIIDHMETSAGSRRNAPPTKDLVEQLVSWFVGKAFEFIGVGRLRQKNGQIPPPVCNLMDPECRRIKQRRQSGPPDEAAVNNFKDFLVDNIMRHMNTDAGALRDTPPAKEIVLQLAGWLYDQTSKFLGFGLRQA